MVTTFWYIWKRCSTSRGSIIWKGLKIRQKVTKNGVCSSGHISKTTENLIWYLNRPWVNSTWIVSLKFSLPRKMMSRLNNIMKNKILNSPRMIRHLINCVQWNHNLIFIWIYEYNNNCIIFVETPICWYCKWVSDSKQYSLNNVNINITLLQVVTEEFINNQTGKPFYVSFNNFPNLKKRITRSTTHEVGGEPRGHRMVKLGQIWILTVSAVVLAVAQFTISRPWKCKMQNRTFMVDEMSLFQNWVIWLVNKSRENTKCCPFCPFCHFWGVKITKISKVDLVFKFYTQKQFYV